MDSGVQNKLRKMTFSMTGTMSSSPLFAPGGSMLVNSSHQNNIIVHSSDHTTDNTDKTTGICIKKLYTCCGACLHFVAEM